MIHTLKDEAYALIKFINVMVLGYVLSFAALFLNWYDDIKIGVLCAILGLSSSYFSEYLFLLNLRKSARVLHIVSIAFIALSYFTWLFI